MNVTILTLTGERDDFIFDPSTTVHHLMNSWHASGKYPCDRHNFIVKHKKLEQYGLETAIRDLPCDGGILKVYTTYRLEAGPSNTYLQRTNYISTLTAMVDAPELDAQMNHEFKQLELPR